MSPRLETAFYELGRLDTMAGKDSPIHRLDPRVKLLTTIVFIVYVVSFGRYEVVRLLPFFLFPVILVALADLPPGYLLWKLAVVSPFVLCIGIFNPILDREIVVQLGPVAISGGWLSLLSIMLRFTLTVGAALLLIATTGLPAICMAMEKLGMPRIFVIQLLMLYRYIFVLIEESIRMIRAYTLRSFSHRKMRYRVFKQLLGNLLLRTLDRAQRIHMAMLSRAFTGEVILVRKFSFGGRELIYITTVTAVLTLFRFYNIAEILGRFILEPGL